MIYPAAASPSDQRSQSFHPFDWVKVKVKSLCKFVQFVQRERERLDPPHNQGLTTAAASIKESKDKKPDQKENQIILITNAIRMWVMTDETVFHLNNEAFCDFGAVAS